MLIIDDILLSPFRGLLWIFEEIQQAAEEERLREAEAVTVQLQQLYAMLESGKISEDEFDRRETELLDRLDSLQESGTFFEDDEEDEEEDEFDA